MSLEIMFGHGYKENEYPKDAFPQYFNAQILPRCGDVIYVDNKYRDELWEKGMPYCFVVNNIFWYKDGIYISMDEYIE